MTEKFYVGSEADCNVVRFALDRAFGCPLPGTINGVPVSSGADRVAKTAMWNALTQQQKDSGDFDPLLWFGWTLRYSELVWESEPGTRIGVWVPPMQDVANAAAVSGVVLTLQETTALLAALATATTNQPLDWTEPP